MELLEKHDSRCRWCAAQSLKLPAVEPVITFLLFKKRIREKKSLIADAAVMSVADVVVKDPANLTTLRC